VIWKAFAIVAALWVGALVWRWLQRWWQRRVLARRREQGRHGELNAVQVLTDAGYRILEDQARREVALWVDGRARSYTLRPDYLVARGDRRFVAEVKTGRKAPDPCYAPTRRQLLEYEVCFPDCGLLLVDMEARQVHEVGWDEVAPVGGAVPRPRRQALWPALGLALAFALGLAAGALTRLL
jgi:hypothetical protein